MAAGIMDLDKGIVWGTTWHHIPSYKEQEVPVEFEHAETILSCPLVKQRLYRYTCNDKLSSVGAWCISRSDYDIVLVDSVGDRFTVVDNHELLLFVKRKLLDEFPKLKIESVGTLFNGATSFVNLKLDEFQVVGDKSPTVSRLMYYNPLGQGCYKACAHNIRIVCNNTLRMSEAEGAANKTLLRVRHTVSGFTKLTEHLVELAEVYMGLEEHKKMLNFLAEKQMKIDDVTGFLNKFCPISEETSDLGAARANRMKAMIITNFKTNEEMNGARTSFYGMLQAVTRTFDHEEPRKNSDVASVIFDGIIGRRADRKDAALKILVDMAKAA